MLRKNTSFVIPILQKKQKEHCKKSPFFISYLITDPFEFGNTVEQLTQTLSKTLQKYSIDILCFRDKTSSNTEELAAACLKIAKEFHIEKILINSDINLAQKLGFDGVHLNSKQFEKIPFLKKQGFYTLISCHTEDEIQNAFDLGANGITYSPIFYKENKAKPKGIQNLATIVAKYQKKDFDIIALGGITDDAKIALIQDTQAKGFAAIRYFRV